MNLKRYLKLNNYYRNNEGVFVRETTFKHKASNHNHLYEVTQPGEYLKETCMQTEICF